MPQTNPASSSPQQDIQLAAAKESIAQSRKAVGSLLDSITPWLVEVGNWIFAGLIALILVVIAALITIGPIDRAIMVATAAFALALPLELAGLCLLRLAQDAQRLGLANEWARAIQGAGFPVGERFVPAAQLSRQKRRTRIILLYSLNILALSVLLTATGLTAALWHMAWWIAVVFLVMAIICLGVVTAALITSEPPATPAEKAQYQHYWDELVRRAQEQAQQTEGGDSEDARLAGTRLAVEHVGSGARPRTSHEEASDDETPKRRQQRQRD